MLHFNYILASHIGLLIHQFKRYRFVLKFDNVYKLAMQFIIYLHGGSLSDRRHWTVKMDFSVVEAS